MAANRVGCRRMLLVVRAVPSGLGGEVTAGNPDYETVAQGSPTLR